MSQVTSGDSITVHYEGRFEDGQVFDSSRDSEPIAFVAGSNELIAGFSNGVIGMKVGDKKTLTIAPAEGYGEHDPERVQTAEMSMLPDDVKVGDRLRAESGEHSFVVEVAAIEGDQATLDANHPLAGKTLVFDVEVMGIES
ncbi:MAG: FKBP-type peptidyl-prolyl cis-trans isomerase [Planctomycetota bacterium]|jgi:peptidylprolyl isomerase